MIGEVEFEHGDRIVVARMAGEIDISNADRLRRKILGEVRSAIDAGLIADVSGVWFLDSAGVRLLFTLHSVLTVEGRPMAIVVPEDSRIKTVLSIVDIARVVWVAPTFDEAMQKLLSVDGAGS